MLCVMTAGKSGPGSSMPRCTRKENAPEVVYAPPLALMASVKSTWWLLGAAGSSITRKGAAALRIVA